MAHSFYPASSDQQRPAQGSGFSPTPAAVQAGVQSPAEIARVLVSEDDPGIQRIYASLLPRHGFELITVPGGDGSLTLELARRFHPDLLITDVNKPGLDGPGICRTLRSDERTARLPLMMVTAMDEWMERQRGAIADDYIVKPFSFEGLIYRITTLIYLRRPAHIRLAQQLIQLPDGEVFHPVTGLMGPQALHRLLPALTSGEGWAIAGLRIEHFAGLVRAYGRPLADSLLLRLSALVQGEAARNQLTVAHLGLDASLAMVGPAQQVDQLAAQVVEQFPRDAMRRLRTAGAPPPVLQFCRLDSSSGPIGGLPELVAAICS